MASKQAMEAKEREQSQNLEMAGGEGACVASKQATKECEGSGPTHSPHRFYFSHGSSGVEKLLFGSPRHPHLATSHDLLSSIH